MSSFVLRSRRVVTPDGVRPADVRVRDGRIEAVTEPARGSADRDVGDLVLMPGIVDSHVHVNEPGRTDWEGFETATRAAAAGGVTTIVDMPLNARPPTTTLAGFEAKEEAAKDRCRVDYAFWGGLVPGNAGELPALTRAGVRGFKCFLVPSGVDEFPHVTEHDLREAMPLLARLGSVLLVHAELPGPIESAPAGGDARSYERYLRSRPRAAENQAIDLMIRLCREHRTRVHIVHLSSSDAVPALAAARREGLPITAETCPHYLTFAAEDVPPGRTEYKCAPPIRERENRERLWEALAEGVVEAVVSDHSPCPGELKRPKEGDFLRAWGGISSLQFLLPATWTEARRRGRTLPDLARWMCAAPARLAGLEARKGAIAPGHDADFVVWNPDAAFVVDGAKAFHRHPTTPYAGRTLHGLVEETIVRGVTVHRRGVFPDPPVGERL